MPDTKEKKDPELRKPGRAASIEAAHARRDDEGPVPVTERLPKPPPAAKPRT